MRIFFQYQIDHCQLNPLKNIDPWEHYLEEKKTNPCKAFLWLAQINEGQKLSQVKTWSQKACEQKKTIIFESQKKWIHWLHKKNIQVLIVTASVSWAVEPMVYELGLDPKQVLGIKTKIDGNGFITDRQEGPVTWGTGKAQALLNYTKNVRPVFCCGNTKSDLALLETSLGDRLCIQSHSQNTPLYKEETELRLHAEKNNWKTHHFFESK